MTQKVVEKVWGRELWIENNENYCGKILELNKGFCCSLHYHKNKDETFYILEGKVLMEFYGDLNIMLPGESVRIIPFAQHRFYGLEDSKIMEFSTHHEDEDSYRIEGEESKKFDNLIFKIYGDGSSIG